jgi:hypothetical protein
MAMKFCVGVGVEERLHHSKTTVEGSHIECGFSFLLRRKGKKQHYGTAFIHEAQTKSKRKFIITKIEPKSKDLIIGRIIKLI